MTNGCSRKSFTAFDHSNSGAWSDGEDDLTLSHAIGDNATPPTHSIPSSMPSSSTTVRTQRSVSQPKPPTQHSADTSAAASSLAKPSNPKRQLQRNSSSSSLPPISDQSHHFIPSVAANHQRRSSTELRTREEMRFDKFADCLSEPSVDMSKQQLLSCSPGECDTPLV
jgi:hypothetical protein